MRSDLIFAEAKKEMRDKHYKDKFSEYINHELTRDERQQIAEHLLVCESCRKEHDEIKLGAELAGTLAQADAPIGVWNSIDLALSSGERSKAGPFRFRSFAAAAAVLAVAIVSAGIFYFGYLKPDGEAIVQSGPTQPVQRTESNSTTTAPPDEFQASSNAKPLDTVKRGSDSSIPDSNDRVGVTERDRPQPAKSITLASWTVETLAGTPKIGGSIGEKIAVGELLETDANSRARIEVANIGDVEIAPNSRVKLVDSNRKQHRLALERGRLHAKILAPPRLFIVDTPSATAVDLGCEYTLEVDTAGNSKLHVTNGFVALERGGRESIVPAGAMCYTRRGMGLGTPFSAESTHAFQAALLRFDFAKGGSESVGTIIKESSFYDMVTLWHLLARVSRNDRGEVFDALAKYAPPPAGVTRDGIMKLNKKMLDDWRNEVERLWFE